MNRCHPATEAFAASFADECVVAQVLIRRENAGFALRHLADREADADTLKSVPLNQLRPLAQFTADGVFRPLKSAPTLRAGWRAFTRDLPELETALNHLYPGALADWFAARSAPPPVTSYREFTARQTGMYRVTAKLTDPQAASVIRSGCHASVCLKRRLWTVETLAPDVEKDKSLIPCLEPCAVLLDLARQAFRADQAEHLPTPPSAADAESAR